VFKLQTLRQQLAAHNKQQRGRGKFLEHPHPSLLQDGLERAAGRGQNVKVATPFVNIRQIYWALYSTADTIYSVFD